MELRLYFAILRQRWPLVAVTMAIALGVAFMNTPREAIYTARSTVVVGPRNFSEDGVDLSNDRATGIERLSRTFALMVDSEPIAQDAIELTGISRSAASVVAATTAAPEPGTQLLRISVTDADPAIARTLANGLANAFVSQVNAFRDEEPAGEGDVPSVPVYVFEEARLPTVPQATPLTRNLAIAGLFGLMAAVAVIVLIEYLDVTVKSADDAERRLGLPVLATIPLLRENQPLAVAPPPRRLSGVASKSA